MKLTMAKNHDIENSLRHQLGGIFLCLCLILFPMVSGCAEIDHSPSKAGDNPTVSDTASVPSPFTSNVKLRSPHQIAHLAWSPDGKQLAVTGENWEVSVWDIEKRQLVTSLRKSKGGSRSAVTYSPDGRYLAAGASTISIWNAKTGAYIRDLIGPYIDLQKPQPIGIRSLQFAPDGKTLLACYSGGKPAFVVALFETESGKLIRKIEPGGATQTGVILSPDGKQLFGTRFYSVFELDESGSTISEHVKTEINIWDTLTGQEERKIEQVHIRATIALGASPDGNTLATGTWTGSRETMFNRKTQRFNKTVVNEDPIRLWDTKKGTLLGELTVESAVKSLTFSPDGQYLVSCQAAPATHDPIRLWRVSTGELIQKIKFTQERDTPDCSFSPDGSMLAAAAGFDVVIYNINGLHF